MVNKDKRRKFDIVKVKNALERLKARDGILIDWESLIIEVSSQLGVSIRQGKEYVKIAKYQIEEEHGRS